MTSTPALAQHEGGESGGGCGDLFGDLIHILRVAETGQPILQKSWVALPKGAGYGWAYCPVAVDANGQELPFAVPVDEFGVPLVDPSGKSVESCDVDPAYAANVVAVDYFGRLSGGRTKERNIRMHLDEVISNIKDAQLVSREATGRLMLGNDCAVDSALKPIASTCAWKAVDSPQENIALYQRIIKYGHIQTDPREIDPAAGDPKLPEAQRPALNATDRAKFLAPATTLLPQCGDAPVPEVADIKAAPWACAQPEALSAADFGFAAGTLAAAADKTGSVTVDLVQYMNRIVRVGLATEYTVPAVNLLPALVRLSPVNPDSTGLSAETVYGGEQLYVAVAAPGEVVPAPANEKFLDFSGVSYVRNTWFNTTLTIIKPLNPALPLGAWKVVTNLPLLKYLEYANPSWSTLSTNGGITGFVRATNDGLRTTEFFHNYSVPVDLGWKFAY